MAMVCLPGYIFSRETIEESFFFFFNSFKEEK